MYRNLSGQWLDAATVNSTACRMVYDLKGHCFYPNYTNQPSEQRRRKHLRNLFWACYSLDKDIAIRFGRPPLLTSDYCDLTLPENLDTICNSQVSPDTVHQEVIVHFAEALQLSQIKEKVCIFLCSLDNPSLVDGSILCQLRQLDMDLETWRLTVPADLRPKLSPSVDLLLYPGMSPFQRRRSIHIQLEYNYLTTIIHTAVRRCGAAYGVSESLPDDLHSVYHSSSDLSLEASRTTLHMLRDGENLLRGDVFG